ncbi:hypothetical protein CHS0354_000458 [Potamilus streckersoni]|uniref:Uncharacterized protein n=1 Tax=Potamilus streckersoni TaxID=2493646 RepID=A0AAE0W945_9BIVA|nr:hypothetical protein CHS0354_000458 [Potamilus streckersoni]
MDRTLLLVSLALLLCVFTSGYAQVGPTESKSGMPGVSDPAEKVEVKRDTVEVSMPVGPLFPDSSKVKTGMKNEVKSVANDMISKDTVNKVVTDVNKAPEREGQKPDSASQPVSGPAEVLGANVLNLDSTKVKPLVEKVDTVKQKIKSLEDIEKQLELKMIPYVIDIGLESIWSTEVSTLVVPVQVSGVSAEAISQYERGGSDELLSGMSRKKDSAMDSAALVEGAVEKDMTDDRFNPLRYTKEIGTIPDQYLVQMEVVSDDRFGCRYLIPVDWKGYSYKKNNVVGYFFKEGVVMVSVGYAAYKELNVWAGLQEAIFMGKNHIPIEDQMADAFLTKKMSVDQAYFGGTPAEVLPEYFDRSDVTYEQIYSDSEVKADQPEEKKADSKEDEVKSISKKADLKKKLEEDKEKSNETKVKTETNSSDANANVSGKSTVSKKNRQTRKKK